MNSNLGGDAAELLWRYLLPIRVTRTSNPYLRTSRHVVPTKVEWAQLLTKLSCSWSPHSQPTASRCRCRCGSTSFRNEEATSWKRPEKTAFSAAVQVCSARAVTWFIS